MRIVLMGAPGSGKATQANLLSARFGMAPVFMPELLKFTARQETDTGVRLGELMNLGLQVPDELSMFVLRDWILQPDLGGNFLLVDFPRTIEQAQSLDQLLTDARLSLDLVLQLVGDEDHFMERLEGREACSACAATYNVFSNPPRVDGMCDLCGGRIRRFAGQNREVVSNRMRIYAHQSTLLEQYYGQGARLRQVPGDREIDHVFHALCQVIEQQAASPGKKAVVRHEVASAGNAPVRKKGVTAKKKSASTEARAPGKRAAPPGKKTPAAAGRSPAKRSAAAGNSVAARKKRS